MAGRWQPSYDGVRVAALEQLGLLCEAVEGLADDAFERPTRLPGWRVAELVAHCANNVAVVARYLAEPAPDHADADLLGYLSGAPGAAAAVAQRAVEGAAGRTPEQLRTAVRAALAEAETALTDQPTDRLVATRLAALSLSDFLATRCVEAVVHSLDLAAAVGRQPAGMVAAPAGRVVVRTLVELLVARAPGRSVEVRIPPYAAVQCVAGPRHTRGTPPGVVEADPLAFVELATGRLAWALAVADGRVRASGERTDLSGYLPLMA
ncbi:MAG: maleylpyruvate isomerase family mycothiol-dependent enzyme [Mycobacteriales bacterium]